MSTAQSNLRGILFTVAAMASFLVNDTLLKLAMEHVPPFETLFMRSLFSLIWCVPLLLLTRSTRQVGKLFDRRVMLRNGMELLAVMGFIIGLANVSIADITALSQLAPILVVVGAAVFLNTRVTRTQIVLAIVAFAGAMLVAQPGSTAFSVFALFGLWNAVMIALRDLSGRQIGAGVPGAVVATGAALVVLVGTAVIGSVFEHWVWPPTEALLMIAGSALFLTAAHYSIFMAFRHGEPGAIAPFYYTSVVFALVSALIIFGTVPNGLALAGMLIIVVCGVAVVALEGRKRRRAVVNAIQPPGM